MGWGRESGVDKILSPKVILVLVRMSEDAGRRNRLELNILFGLYGLPSGKQPNKIAASKARGR